MAVRRRVVFQDAFLDRLDLLLPTERPGVGTPSRSDFMAFELPPLVDLLATEFDAVTPVVPGFLDVRVLIISGILVSRFAIT